MEQLRMNMGLGSRRLLSRWLPLCLCAFLLLPRIVRANIPLPKYAVAYPYRGGIRIAELTNADEWHIDFLPDAFYGAVAERVIEPAWSPDGRTLYYDALTP